MWYNERLRFDVTGTEKGGIIFVQFTTIEMFGRSLSLIHPSSSRLVFTENLIKLLCLTVADRPSFDRIRGKEG